MKFHVVIKYGVVIYERSEEQSWEATVEVPSFRALSEQLRYITQSWTKLLSVEITLVER
jgi:hypothetical protein